MIGEARTGYCISLNGKLCVGLILFISVFPVCLYFSIVKSTGIYTIIMHISHVPSVKHEDGRSAVWKLEEVGVIVTCIFSWSFILCRNKRIFVTAIYT